MLYFHFDRYLRLLIEFEYTQYKNCQEYCQLRDVKKIEFVPDL